LKLKRGAEKNLQPDVKTCGIQEFFKTGDDIIKIDMKTKTISNHDQEKDTRGSFREKLQERRRRRNPSVVEKPAPEVLGRSVKKGLQAVSSMVRYMGGMAGLHTNKKVWEH